MSDQFPKVRVALVALATLASCLVPVTRCLATSLTVPDDAPTIQAALDSGVDTVLVRPGTYAESLILSRQVYLASVSDPTLTERPLIQGLMIQPSPTHIIPTFAIYGLHIVDRILIDNSDVVCHIAYAHCTLGGGIGDISQYITTSSVRIVRCVSYGDLNIAVDGPCLIDSCTVNGAVSAEAIDATLLITDSHVTGLGTGTGVWAQNIDKCMIYRSSISNFGAGLYAYVEDTLRIADCNIRDCSGGGLYVLFGNAQLIHNNIVRNCGGIGIAAVGNIDMQGNRVEYCGYIGISAESDQDAIIAHNVVVGCGNDGIIVSGTLGQGTISHNTSVNNARSGFGMEVRYVRFNVALANNIGYNNQRYGVEWYTPLGSSAGCNDWFGNALGDVVGRPPSIDDFSVDPRFCGPTDEDFTLRGDSPLVNRSGCGALVGALSIGCDTVSTSIMITRFWAERTDHGVQISWEAHALGRDASLSLERASTIEGPWHAVQAEPSGSGGVMVIRDREALADQPYWYRLVQNQVNARAVVGDPVFVGVIGQSRFDIIRVSPNPNRGRIRVELEVGRDAMIDLELFDIQGRQVASLANGFLLKGRHVFEVGTRAIDQMERPGVYLLRYRYPGGEAARRVLRSR